MSKTMLQKKGEGEESRLETGGVGHLSPHRPFLVRPRGVRGESRCLIGHGHEKEDSDGSHPEGQSILSTAPATSASNGGYVSRHLQQMQAQPSRTRPGPSCDKTVLDLAPCIDVP
jgi:hypothetical protein